MNDDEKKILTRYIKDFDYSRIEIYMMRLLLNEEMLPTYIHRLLGECGEIYLHGSNYLGYLACLQLEKYISISAIVTKKKSLLGRIKRERILLDEEIISNHKDIPIIITELKGAEKIKEMLMCTFDQKRIFYLGELFVEAVYDDIY